MLEARGEWSAVSLQADWLAADGAQRRYGLLAVALLRAAWRLASGRRSCWSGLASGSVSRGSVPSSIRVRSQAFFWDCQDWWSRVLWHPRRPSASYCVELEQYLVHHRYHCNVPRLPTLTKSVIKPTHFAVVADDRPCAHVQRSPHQSPATPDSPMPSLLAAVSGPGRQSHQGGQSLAIPVAQFGKVSHQGCRG